MLTKLMLENWKSFWKAELYIDPLTMLIGANASGKSNILDALLFLQRIASGVALTTALQGDNTLAPIRGGLEWAGHHPLGGWFALGVVVKTGEDIEYEYYINCLTGSECNILSERLSRVKYRAGKKTKAAQTILFLTNCDEEAQSIATKFYKGKKGANVDMNPELSTLFQVSGQAMKDEIHQGVVAVTSALHGLFILDPIPSHMRRYAPLASALAADAGNISGVIAALPEAKRQEVEDLLTQYAGQLPEWNIQRIFVERVGKFSSDAMLYCQEPDFIYGDKPFFVDARSLSDGTLRFLAILTALLTRPVGSLLVIEEVDTGLHPSRAHLLLDALRTLGTQRGVDVLVTTHNPALLDAMGTELVPFITVAHRDPRTGCSVLTLLEDIAQLPKLLAQGPVGRLSSQGLIEQALSRETGVTQA